MATTKTRRNNTGTGLASRALRAAHLAHHAARCCYCGITVQLAERGRTLPTDATLEHVECSSEGGADGWANLALCCRRCNSSRGARPVAQWLAAKLERDEAIARNRSRTVAAARIRSIVARCRRFAATIEE